MQQHVYSCSETFRYVDLGKLSVTVVNLPFCDAGLNRGSLAGDFLTSSFLYHLLHLSMACSAPLHAKIITFYSKALP